MPDFSSENLCPHPVVGIDEVGRGPWAGPVIAAAVIIDGADADLLATLNDSKKLSAKRRDDLCARLIACSGIVWALGEASVAEIDELNILQATFLAMQRAAASLPFIPAHALIDGNKVPPGLPCPATAIVKGDGKSASIAAASIIAKVHRDRIMLGLDRDYPNYGWCHNAGYGTPEHQAGLLTSGVTKHHRKSFASIRKMLTQNTS